jgi:aspartate carbamoyltransferase catalytic subunit
LRLRRSLIDLDDLSEEELTYLFTRAKRFAKKPPKALLDGVPVANVFFEQSTRTFTSFNLAQLRLGMHVVNLAPHDMSLSTKGETIDDSVMTLSAMGFDVLVVRHKEEGFAEHVASVFEGHVVNAGDGAHAHPTQGLLDVYTIRQEFGELRGRRVAIVGDVVHSRVAHSTMKGLKLLGAEVMLVGPEAFLPEGERDFDSILPSVDAIVLLRIQRERFDSMPMSYRDYVAGYQLNAERLTKLKPGAIVLHPGPYNRGVELDESVLHYGGWRYAQQVANGVTIRMAVLDFLVNGAD